MVLGITESFEPRQRHHHDEPSTIEVHRRTVTRYCLRSLAGDVDPLPNESATFNLFIQRGLSDQFQTMGDYTALASMMADHAEAAIFRRFDTLNIKNLLYMQAELVDLEDQLHDIESEDKKSEAPNKVSFSSIGAGPQEIC